MRSWENCLRILLIRKLISFSVGDQKSISMEEEGVEGDISNMHEPISGQRFRHKKVI